MTEPRKPLTLDQIRKLKRLSNRFKIASTTEEDISRQIANDPDLYELTDEELSEFDLPKKDHQ